ncbi:transcription intermediary factor 1-alpha-like [Aulostomus maculatus]
MDTCPVCHSNFLSREPKLLPCLHSFCKKCLPPPSRNLASTEPTKVDSASKPLNVIRCPVCRQECMEVDVIENVFVKDLVEAPSSTVEKTVQLCMTCDDNTEAAGFCVDCVEFLCATCVEAHQRVKFTKDHTIKPKTKESQEVRGVSSQRPMFCDSHKQEPLKLFCETCDLLTCRDCQLVEHKDHNYQFLEDAYKNHQQYMESMTHQLQEKKKVIEEVSNSINNGLLHIDQNRRSVHSEIKKSICSLILEINKKGKTLINQLEAATRDHESVLQKQQEDIGYLSRHLDHVIKFTKWATARNRGTALLICKRLILFQIGNLLRAKCSTSFVPQSSVRFQCRSSYWASNVDLGSLVVESVPGHQLGGFQGIPHQLSQPGQAPSGLAHSFAPGAQNNTLAQLQMQVDKLNPQAYWHPQPPPPPWTWCQSVRLQRTVPRPLQGGSPSHCVPPQTGRRFMMPPHNHVSPTSSLSNPGFTPQIETTYLNRRNDASAPVYTLKSNYSQSLPPSLPHRNVQGHQYSSGYAAVSQVEKPGTVSWKPLGLQQVNGAVGSAVKKRQGSSPGPIIIIKDEPDYGCNYVQSNQRASLPDSTGDQPQTWVEGEGNKVTTPFNNIDNNLQSPSWRWPQDRSEMVAPGLAPSLGAELQENQHPARREDSNEDFCAVCQTVGELLRCNTCRRVFHLTCHVPPLLSPPSGEWLCSLCCDLSEIDCDSKPEAKRVKKELDPEEGFQLRDRQVTTCLILMLQKCERLLLHLFCNDLRSDFQDPAPPSVCDNNRLAIKGPINLSTVKKRLEAKQGVCYQSTAEFVADIRLIFGNCAILSETDAKVSMTGKKLKEMFEEHLRTIFPGQNFPQIKMEIVAPPDSQLSLSDSRSPPISTCTHPAARVERREQY